MRRLRQVYARLYGLLFKSRIEREMEDELRFHIKMRTALNIESGMSPEQASRAATRRFGNLGVIQDFCRDIRGGGLLETFLKDLSHGLRLLSRTPLFTAVAVVTLALGIGANTAIFSVVNAVLLSPLPYRDARHLYVLTETSQQLPRVSPSYPNFLDWRKQSRSFEQMAAVLQQDFNLSAVDQPERIGGSAVSANFFSMLGVRPIIGRDFLPAEDNAGTEPVAILTHGLWQRRFGADPHVVGKVLTLDGRRFTVIGVLPETIKKAAGGEIYAPIGLWVKEMMERGAHGDTIVMARLKTEFTQEAASAEMSTIAGRLAREYPGTNTGYGVNVTSLRDSIVGDSKTPLLLLLGGVGFVLLIACANVANLLLVRATTRGKEFAIRSALGAGRSRIARQLLTESMALALAAGTVGLLLGNWGIGWLLTLVPEGILQGTTVGIDRPVLAFTGGISVLTAIIFGLAPALQTSRLNLNEALKEGGRSSSDAPGRHRLRRTLAVAEIALALVLAISSGLMLRSFRILLRVDPGFDPHHVLTMQVNLPNTSYGSADQIAVFSRQALDRIAALPGVTNAALGTSLPLTNDHSRSDISIEGRPLPAPGQFPHPDFHRISAAYPKVLGLPLLRGRLFTDADNASAPEVAIISESLARRYWPDEDPIGKRFSLGKPRPTTKWATIVGVVGDTKQYGLDAQARMEVYLSYLQHPMYSPVFMARSSTKPEVLTAAMRTAIQGIDPDLPVHDESTMDDVVASSVGTRRIMMQLFAIFAALALVLATVGIYGVISYSVAQRTQEIGIRMALGAQGRSVLGLVIGQGLRLALAGIVIGLAGAAVLTHLLASLLFGVEPIDLATFSCVAALYVLTTVAACYFPARRAMKVDPTIALRCG